MNFAAGGVATPADAALMMQLGKAVQVDPKLTALGSGAYTHIRHAVALTPPNNTNIRYSLARTPSSVSPWLGFSA